MKLMLLVFLLSYFVSFAQEDRKLSNCFASPNTDFLCALDLDSEGNLLGKKIRIKIKVLVERDVPFAKVVSDKRLFNEHVHVISVTTCASSLKNGQYYHIEGIIADGPCYGAHVVYMHQFYVPESK